MTILKDDIKNKPCCFFYVSSKLNAGGGHIARSLSLAAELSDEFDILFIPDTNNNYKFLSKIKNNKFGITTLYSNEQLAKSIIIVDSYNVSNRELLKLKDFYGTLIYMDDFGNSPDIVDIAINISSLNNKVSKVKGKLIVQGIKYALLSSEYSDYQVSVTSKIVDTILISFGIIDSKGFSVKILDALQEFGYRNKVIVALGSKSLSTKLIKANIKKYTFNVDIVKDVDGLYNLMNESDMVIGSGGVTLLERMALGKPSISIPVSSNQEQQIELSGLMGATFAVASDLHDINNGLEFILNNYKGREKMSRTARYLVDGNGAKRTASVITDTQINV